MTDALERSDARACFTEELLPSSKADAVLPETLRVPLLWRIEGKAAHVQDVLRVAAVAERTVDHGPPAAALECPKTN
jgi:hypothetical protein